MKKAFLLGLIVLMAITTGCKKDPVAELTITDAAKLDMNFPVAGASTDVAFTSVLDWTVATNSPWITVSPASGLGGVPASITVTVAANDTYDGRIGKVTITSVDKTLELNVTQGQVNSIDVEDDYYYINGDGGTVKIPVMTNIAYDIVLVDNPDWISYTKSKGIEQVDANIDVKFNDKYEYREAQVIIKADGYEDTVTVAQGASSWSLNMVDVIPQNAANMVSLAMLDGKLIVSPGNGDAPKYLNPATGEVEGTLDLGDIEVGFIKNDDAGNVLICNHTVYDPETWSMNPFKVWSISSLSDTPKEIISYSGYQPLGARLQVRGDINGKALIVSAYEGIADITVSCSMVYWTVDGGKVSEGTVADLTGFVGLNWFPGYWNLGSEGNPAICPVTNDIKDGFIFSVYDENVIYHVDGTTFACTAMMTPSGDSWGQAYNTMDTRSYDGHNYMALCPQPFWPEWGFAPQVLIYDITDIKGISAEMPVVTEASSLIFYPNTYSFLDGETEVGVVPCGDILMDFVDGAMKVYYIDHNNHTMEAFKVAL